MRGEGSWLPSRDRQRGSIWRAPRFTAQRQLKPMGGCSCMEGSGGQAPPPLADLYERAGANQARWSPVAEPTSALVLPFFAVITSPSLFLLRGKKKKKIKICVSSYEISFPVQSFANGPSRIRCFIDCIFLPVFSPTHPAPFLLLFVVLSNPFFCVLYGF